VGVGTDWPICMCVLWVGGGEGVGLTQDNGVTKIFRL
jgi:hypothetical protein